MKWLLRIGLFVLAAGGIALLIFHTPDTDPAEMRAKYGGEPSQFVMLADGQKVHIRDEGPRNGDGEALAIILLHGSSADLHTWEPWAQALREDYRVIRYDQIGHGLTGPAVDGAYHLENFTSDIDAIADHLGIEKFVLAGNSMGGWITAGYALEHSERLAGIVLVDASGAPVSFPEGEGGNTGFSIAATPGINQIMRLITPRSLVEQSLRQSVSNQEIVTQQAVDRYWELLRFPGNRAATLERFGTPRVVYDEAQISALDVPALVMWGQEDALVPVEAGRWYHQHLTNSTLVEYAGIGHLPHEETVEASLADLTAWLASLGSKQKTGDEAG